MNKYILMILCLLPMGLMNLFLKILSGEGELVWSYWALMLMILSIYFLWGVDKKENLLELLKIKECQVKKGETYLLTAKNKMSKEEKEATKDSLEAINLLTGAIFVLLEDMSCEIKKGPKDNLIKLVTDTDKNKLH